MSRSNRRRIEAAVIEPTRLATKLPRTTEIMRTNLDCYVSCSRCSREPANYATFSLKLTFVSVCCAYGCLLMWVVSETITLKTGRMLSKLSESAEIIATIFSFLFSTKLD